VASLGELFSALVERVMGRVDAFALYPATVKAMNDDGTVDLKPDSARWGAGLSRVPVRGLPGVVVKVKTDARVHIAFSEGDVTRPVAVLFDADSLDTITVTASVKAVVKAPAIYLADEAGAAPLARVGDLIEVAMPSLIPFAGTVAGAPATGTLTVTDTMQGYITSGSSKANSA